MLNSELKLSSRLPCLTGNEAVQDTDEGSDHSPIRSRAGTTPDAHERLPLAAKLVVLLFGLATVTWSLLIGWLVWQFIRFLAG